MITWLLKTSAEKCNSSAAVEIAQPTKLLKFIDRDSSPKSDSMIDVFIPVQIDEPSLNYSTCEWGGQVSTSNSF